MADSISLSLLFLFFIIIPFSTSYNYPAAFNFGDSNSDTGDFVTALGDTLYLPNGRYYFNNNNNNNNKNNSRRFCDGRLLLDFLMDGMDLPFLNAYLDSLGAPSFRTGANFAAAGSSIRRAAATPTFPFTFWIQVNQFLRFKERVIHLQTISRRPNKYLPEVDYFSKGLYIFDIGQNDLATAFHIKSYDEVVASIPSVLSEFEAGIKLLYDQGARNFWIHNTGPLGCLAQNVLKFGTDPSKLDTSGCVSMHNQAAKLQNLQIHALCRKLQGQYSDANVTYIDVFTIKSNLISNYSRYGFEQPIMACCGYGGPPLNYIPQVSCGKTKILSGISVTPTACGDSTKYINWDGIHYTEAANQYVASQILSGKYSDPPFSDKNTDYKNNFITSDFLLPMKRLFHIIIFAASFIHF